MAEQPRDWPMPEQINDRLLNWASILESNTATQADIASRMPFIFPHIALMPDAHLGLGATVGSVIPTIGAIMPAAVGVDIGCGMTAVLTQFHRADIADLDPAVLHAAISAAVPLSAGKYNQEVSQTPENTARIHELFEMAGADQAWWATGNGPRDWRYQLGSLGSGNHFIEVSVDELDQVWLFLHSGSRGVGNKLAQRHIRIAQEQCERRWIQLPHPDLAYLVEGEPEFDAYLEALTWAQRFAYLNRAEMMDRVAACFGAWAGFRVDRLEVIDCHHNYTARERHFGKEVWLSRKGAIEATAGHPGLIPGSMGAASYVVTGKGNPRSLCSAPHGAGRNHSRSAARKLFDRADLDARMAGIAWGRSDAFLDEHPDAYKDIDVVMRDAADLVEIRHTLRQLVNVKGD